VKAVITGRAGGFNWTLAVTEVPESVADTTAVSSVLTVPAVAVKVALESPAGTVTDAGTGSCALLLARATGVAESAPPLKLRLQLVCSPDPRVGGLHATPVRTTGFITVTVPLPPEIGMEDPLCVAATVLDTLMVPVAEAVAVSTATTPFEICVLLNPLNRQRMLPVLGMHVSDFWAAVAAGPADTFTLINAVAGN